MKTLTPIALCLALSLTACAGMTDTQQRTLSGAAIGAGAGTVIGAIGGNAGLGAVLGAGAAGGFICKQSEEANFQRGFEAGQASRPN